MSYKFIFDTNALQVSHIEKFEKANLSQAYQSGRFSFYVTPILLKERLNFLFNPKAINNDTVKTVGRFLCDLKWQRLLREPGGPEGIFTMELEGKTYSKYIFDDRMDNIKQALTASLYGEDPLTEENKQYLREDGAQWFGKKQDNKRIYMRAWEDVKRQNKEALGELPEGNALEFSSFRNHNFKNEAIRLIENIESPQPKGKLISYWRDKRYQCPYFNKYVEGRLYVFWKVMSSRERPAIDLNCLEDIQHLIYLIGVDAIISEETGFMKEACKELFPDKDYLSVDEFISKISDGYMSPMQLSKKN